MADLEASTNSPTRPLPSYGEAVGTTMPLNDASNGHGKVLTEEERKKEEQLGAQSEGSSLREGIDILGQQDVDPALSQKMHLVNNVSGSTENIEGDTRHEANC